MIGADTLPVRKPDPAPLDRGRGKTGGRGPVDRSILNRRPRVTDRETGPARRGQGRLRAW